MEENTELICLDNLRRFVVREKLLNCWYRATTVRAPHIELTVKRERRGVWVSEDDGRLLIVADSFAGVAVATHPRLF